MEQMKIQPEDWKEDYKEFDEATEKFYKREWMPNLQGFPAVLEAMRSVAEMQVCCVFVCPAV
ncbi:MAG: hypothetical protein ACLUV8_05675 [Clostridium sp.]